MKLIFFGMAVSEMKNQRRSNQKKIKVFQVKSTIFNSTYVVFYSYILLLTPNIIFSYIGVLLNAIQGKWYKVVLFFSSQRRQKLLVPNSVLIFLQMNTIQIFFDKMTFHPYPQMIFFFQGNIILMVKKVHTCNACQKGIHYSKAAVLRCRRTAGLYPEKQQEPHIKNSTQIQKEPIDQEIKVTLIPNYSDNTLRNNHFRRAMQADNARGHLNCFKGIQSKVMRHPCWKRRFSRQRSSNKFIRLLIEKTTMIERVKKIFIAFMRSRSSQGWQDQIQSVVSQYFDRYIQEYGQFQEFGQFRLDTGFQLLGQFIRKLPYATIKRIIRQQEKALIKTTHHKIFTLEQLRKNLRRQFRQRFRTHLKYNISFVRDERTLQSDFSFLFTAAWNNSYQDTVKLLKQQKIYRLTHQFLREVVLPTINAYRGQQISVPNTVQLPQLPSKQNKVQNSPTDRYEVDDFMAPNFNPAPLLISGSVSPSLYRGRPRIFKSPPTPMSYQVKVKRMEFLLDKLVKRKLKDSFSRWKRILPKPQSTPVKNYLYGISGIKSWRFAPSKK